MLWVACMATILQHFLTLSLPPCKTILHSWCVEEKRTLSSYEIFNLKQLWYAITWTLPFEIWGATPPNQLIKKQMHINLSWSRVVGCSRVCETQISDTCYKHMFNMYSLTILTNKLTTKCLSLICLFSYQLLHDWEATKVKTWVFSVLVIFVTSSKCYFSKSYFWFHC